MTALLLAVALFPAQGVVDQSRFSCAEVTLSAKGKITASQTVVGSGDERSDKRALKFLKTLDFSRVEVNEYSPVTKKITKREIVPVAGTGFLMIEHYDPGTFGIAYTGELLESCADATGGLAGDPTSSRSSSAR